MLKIQNAINVDLSGKTVKILGVNDIIKKGDFYRPLHESAHLDGGFDTTYRNEEWEGTSWHHVENEIGAWIGKSQTDYLNFDASKEEIEEIITSGYMEFEIARVVG